jgi:hypothetical protein
VLRLSPGARERDAQVGTGGGSAVADVDAVLRIPHVDLPAVAAQHGDGRERAAVAAVFTRGGYARLLLGAGEGDALGERLIGHGLSV